MEYCLNIIFIELHKTLTNTMKIAKLNLKNWIELLLCNLKLLWFDSKGNYTRITGWNIYSLETLSFLFL